MDEFSFTKVACVSPHNVVIGNPAANADIIIDFISEARFNDAELIVFPELCLCGYTCGDLFLQPMLIDSCLSALFKIAENVDSEFVFVGLPFFYNNCLYNCTAVLHDGAVIAVIPKTYLPNSNEFYEQRYFTSGANIKAYIPFYDNKQIFFGTDILIHSGPMTIGCELCEDAWAPIPPSSLCCVNGANVIVNLSASNELAGKHAYRENLIKMLSASNICCYIYSSASFSESSSDTVFSGHRIICENGTVLESSDFMDTSEISYAILDIEKIYFDRSKSTSFYSADIKKAYRHISCDSEVSYDSFFRKVSLTPFVPDDIEERTKRAEEIVNIQAMGLVNRLKKINCKKVVIGISGGLDSTLALLIAIRAFEILNYDKKGIIGITMPCFGTTSRTLTNSLNLMKEYKITSLTIDITDACTQHLKDINHPIDSYDVTYENVQARERTQVLMDIANKYDAIVIGTGDLSELALGWCTYNGDHMSMYSVNSSIPKTLVRYLVKYFADTVKSKNIKKCLYDILDTPISPELLPPTENGAISQKTEDSIGSYLIHDFILYYFLRYGFSPIKIFYLLVNSMHYDEEWKDVSPEYILKNFKIFYKRFFSQQFKRNCVPDGVKVGSVSLSPRADWRMPSEASAELWLNSLKYIEENLTFDSTCTNI